MSTSQPKFVYTKTHQMFLLIALTSSAIFFSILTVPYLAPILWEVAFAKFLGNLMLSGLISTLSASLGSLLIVLTDQKNNNQIKASTEYHHHHLTAWLKWSAILFTGLVTMLSLGSYFLITTPVILPASLIATVFVSMAAGLALSMFLANKHLNLFSYQPKAPSVVNNVNNEFKTVNEHHYKNELTLEQQKAAEEAAKKAAKAVLEEERKKKETAEAQAKAEAEKAAAKAAALQKQAEANVYPPVLTQGKLPHKTMRDNKEEDEASACCGCW